ncbi:hypothetical protein PRCB_06575 [Pantoea rodasii]|uniref:Uncharacterized protein n=1 Tax=Pantoea rodasii TaxID=1076549 RepID=A0A2M9WFQ7_9GAMM|nr:hypothetical protein HA45_24205 [Pantoea rodasii]PJZ06382.1 hypothetical protein PRCB_06575 [Pantoea rodasii]
MMPMFFKAPLTTMLEKFGRVSIIIKKNNIEAVEDIRMLFFMLVFRFFSVKNNMAGKCEIKIKVIETPINTNTPALLSAVLRRKKNDIGTIAVIPESKEIAEMIHFSLIKFLLLISFPFLK